MTINYQSGGVDAPGARIRGQAASPEGEHWANIRDVLAAGDFWGGVGSVVCQEFTTQLGLNCQPAATWPAPRAPSARAGPNSKRHENGLN